MATKIRVCSINSPIYGVNNAIFLDKEIRIFEQTCDEVFVITGNFRNVYGAKVHVIEVEGGRSGEQVGSLFGRICHHMLMQLKLAANLITTSRNFDIVFFNIGEYRNLAPILVSRLLGKKTIIFHRGGDKIREAKLSCTSGWSRILPPIEALLLKMSYSLANHILCESPSIIRVGNLEKYRSKVMIWGGYHIETERFKMTQLPKQRSNLIGYTGRLSPVKGLCNLVRAVPLVLQQQSDARFVVAGEGEEKKKIQDEIANLRVGGSVSLTSWIPRDEFPQFLNQIKLFVMPSYEEGIPSVIREAMACGAIVLTTAVGGIPDIVEDGKNGFIMEDNSPECIARNVLRALDSPSLDKIAENARAVIEREHSFEASVRRWKKLLPEIVPMEV